MGARSMRVILNGSRAPRRSIDVALAAMRHRGHQIDVRVTGRGAGAAALAREAVEERIDVVVAGGGDGTVNEVANGILAASDNPQVTMAVLPLGSSNDFARGCEVPLDNPTKALYLAATAEPRAIDVARVNQGYFLNAVIGGLGAAATFRTSEKMKQMLGGAAYSVSGFLSALRPSAYPVRLRTSDGVEEWPMTFVAIANGKWAGGVPIAPRAALCDGLLDLLLVPAVSLAKLPVLLRDFRAAGRRDPLFVRRQQREWVEIDTLGTLPVSPDGERLGDSKLRIEVLKQRLPFALPPASMVCQ
ncbi:MAG: YegS/Rv2252/BmrU family lipid kinase [Pseudomonadota bacterium]